MLIKGASFFFVILISAISAYASNWAIGLKGGLSKLEYHVVHENSDYDSSYDISPTLSFFAETHSNRYFEQQIGLGYFHIGGYITYIEYGPHMQGWRVQEYIQLDYLLLSFAVKAKINISKFVPYIIIGSQVDYLINSKYEYILDHRPVNGPADNSDFNGTNFTPIIGFGIGYIVNKIDVFLEYQPYFHLMKFNKTDYHLYKEYITNGYVINIGILMPL